MAKQIIRLTEGELREMVKCAVRESLNKNFGIVLTEGVKYDANSDTFSFNFEKDDETDIIKLTKVGYNVYAFGHCFYYAYEFTDNVSSDKRTAFIHSIKFPDKRISDEDKNKFIINAVNSLDRDISLPLYDLIVYPESLSELNREMFGYMNRIAQPKIANMELVKELPSKIEFDYERFEIEVLQSKLPNGRNRYTDRQREEVLNNIHSMMDAIHNLEYFSIARDVKKTKYRQFIKNYYKFRNNEDKQLYETIINSNVLIVDDIITSGTTISFILKCLRSINDSNKIVIFSLIGRNIN